MGCAIDGLEERIAVEQAHLVDLTKREQKLAVQDAAMREKDAQYRGRGGVRERASIVSELVKSVGQIDDDP